jgi:hypothetical protein
VAAEIHEVVVVWIKAPSAHVASTCWWCEETQGNNTLRQEKLRGHSAPGVEVLGRGFLQRVAAWSTYGAVDSQLHWSDYWAKLPRAGVASESSDIEPARMQASGRGSVGGGPVVGLRAKEERAFQPETRHSKHREGIR